MYRYAITLFCIINILVSQDNGEPYKLSSNMKYYSMSENHIGLLFSESTIEISEIELASFVTNFCTSS